MRIDTRLDHDWFDRPLPPNVVIGPGSWLYSAFSMLHCRSAQPEAVRIGTHSGVYDGCHFDLGPDGSVVIGDYCSIVGAIINTNRRVRIDDYAFVAHEVVIADRAYATPWEDGAEYGDPVADGVRIGENAWIGARAILLGTAQIGEGAIVGAAAVVTEDVPPYAVVAGNPARIVGWATAEGGT